MTIIQMTTTLVEADAYVTQTDSTKTYVPFKRNTNALWKTRLNLRRFKETTPRNVSKTFNASIQNLANDRQVVTLKVQLTEKALATHNFNIREI